MPSEFSPSSDDVIRKLFEETLKDSYDDDAPWEAVFKLRHDGNLEFFKKAYQVAVEYIESDDVLKRARGINVLAQIGCTQENRDGINFEERIQIAIEYLSDKAELVAEAAAWALAGMRHRKALDALLAAYRHVNPRIRQAVAAGLLGETSVEAVDVLIALMQDVDDDVRDYATWSLGSVPASGAPVDTVEVREALRARLNDVSEDVRFEAIWGLAIRKDTTGLRMLLERLETDCAVSGDEEAAIYILSVPSETSISQLREGIRFVLSGVGDNEI